MSALPKFTMRELLEAGVHYGHRTARWNPRMSTYLFGSRNGIHIIDLQKTVPLLHNALKVVYDVVKKNGRVLFVGTKQQASDPLAEAAKRCGQYYVNFRWLGGMLTNWQTVSQSISTLRDLNKQLEENEETGALNKKEALEMSRRRDKLERSLGGIMDMGGKPDLIIVIDTNREDIAIQEANKLNIPVIAVLDSNSSPAGVDYPIPGNDDAIRSIQLYCKLFSDAALAGIQESIRGSGVDVGAAKDLPKEALPAGNDNKAEEEKAASKTTTKKAELKAVKDDSEKKPAAKKEPAKKAEEKAEKPAAKKAAPAKKAEAEKKPVAKKPAAKKAPAKKAAAKKAD